MQQKISLSDPVLIRKFSKQLESDPVLIRQKIAFRPDPSSSLIAPPSLFTLLQRCSDSSFLSPVPVLVQAVRILIRIWWWRWFNHAFL